MSPDKLAYMANQIGKFFAHQKHDVASPRSPIIWRSTWDPRMRSGILAHLDDVQLDPLVREAMKSLQVAARIALHREPDRLSMLRPWLGAAAIVYCVSPSREPCGSARQEGFQRR